MYYSGRLPSGFLVYTHDFWLAIMGKISTYRTHSPHTTGKCMTADICGRNIYEKVVREEAKLFTIVLVVNGTDVSRRKGFAGTTSTEDRLPGSDVFFAVPILFSFR